MERAIANKRSEVTELYQLYHREEPIAVFIGAGCSSPLKIPMWREMLIALNEEFNCYQTSQELTDDIERIGYAQVASNIKASTSDGTKYTQLIQQYSRPVVCNYTSLHLEIIKLSKLIVTTNYDRSFELTFEALKRLENSQKFSYKTSSLGRFDRIGWGRDNHIFHLHGDVETGNLILTNESYLEQYDKPNSGVASLVSAIFSTIPTVFIGFSFEDESFINFLKQALEQIKLERKQYNQPEVKHYCIMSSNIRQHYVTVQDLLKTQAPIEDLIRKNIICELTSTAVAEKRFEFGADAIEKIERSSLDENVIKNLIWLYKHIEKNKEKTNLLSEMDIGVITYQDGKYLEIEQILRSITEIKQEASAATYKPAS